MIRNLFFFLLFTSFLSAEKNTQPLYRIHDLGEVDKFSEKIPPRINASGIAIGNNSDGAFVWQINVEEYHPKLFEGQVTLHAINSQGDVLVSVWSPYHEMKWEIWPNCARCTENERQIIDLSNYKKKAKKLTLNALTENKIVYGSYVNHHGELQPVIIKPKTSPPRGIFQGVTQSGTLYGFFRTDKGLVPSVWSESSGLSPLKNYRSHLIPEGTIKMESLTMTNDGVVYGTYWVEHNNSQILKSQKLYYNFAWKPETGEYKQIDIDGMRIQKVNNSHTLIGTLNGKPVICEGGKKPQELARLLDENQRKEWEIQIISDINDSNCLVGIGKKNGIPHLFFAERLGL